MLPSTSLLVQVSVFDTISKDAQYTKRVRRLGEFHPDLGPSKATDGQDIDDPLYGNVGGAEEAVRTDGAVLRSRVIQPCICLPCICLAGKSCAKELTRPRRLHLMLSMAGSRLLKAGIALLQV